MEKKIKLSLVIPTYKQEKIILRQIDQTVQVLREMPFDFEIIIVVDGFVDRTYKILKKLRRSYLKVLGTKENLGKGAALRQGMLEATGDIIGFIDGGMDIDPRSIEMVLNHFLWYEADIAIGSKLHPVSRVKYPFQRKVLSWGYRTIIRFMFGLKIRDSQVGLKVFRRKVVRDVFPKLLVKRFAFDIELLAVAYSRGFHKIYEAPIKLKFNDSSSIVGVNFWKAILNMFVDTCAIWYRLNILNYYNKQKAISNKQ